MQSAAACSPGMSGLAQGSFVALPSCYWFALQAPMTGAWAARCVLKEFDMFESKHFDVALRKVLQNPPASSTSLEASFVYLAIGRYAERASGCEEGLGCRPSEWGNHWCQEGARRDPLLAKRQHWTLHHRCVQKGNSPSDRLARHARVRLRPAQACPRAILGVRLAGPYLSHEPCPPTVGGHIL